jgi:predicted RNase H-like HicB family nuclease
MTADAQEDHAYVEQYDGHTIVYDQGPTSWGAYVEDLPVCFTVGDSFEETQRLIREAIAIYLDELRRQDQQDSSAAAS